MDVFTQSFQLFFDLQIFADHCSGIVLPMEQGVCSQVAQITNLNLIRHQLQFMVIFFSFNGQLAWPNLTVYLAVNDGFGLAILIGMFAQPQHQSGMGYKPTCQLDTFITNDHHQHGKPKSHEREQQAQAPQDVCERKVAGRLVRNVLPQQDPKQGQQGEKGDRFFEQMNTNIKNMHHSRIRPPSIHDFCYVTLCLNVDRINVFLESGSV